MKFRKRPVVIEAVQIPEAGYENREAGMAFMAFIAGSSRNIAVGPDATVHIDTLEGEMQARPGDWIIRGIKGEFYPCKPDIFEQTYEKVEEG